MSLDDHDRLIAYVLGLSHALNIAFFTALAESGEAAPRLARMSSTTFDAQLDVASRVAQESPELYYEIQSLNDYGAESLEALSQAVERAAHRGALAGSRCVRCFDAPRARLSARTGAASPSGAPEGSGGCCARCAEPQSESLAALNAHLSARVAVAGSSRKTALLQARLAGAHRGGRPQRFAAAQDAGARAGAAARRLAHAAVRAAHRRTAHLLPAR